MSEPARADKTPAEVVIDVVAEGCDCRRPACNPFCMVTPTDEPAEPPVEVAVAEGCDCRKPACQPYCM